MATVTTGNSDPSILGNNDIIMTGIMIDNNGLRNIW